MGVSKQIEILDSTLRDGEQTNGVSFLPHEKLMIARQLLSEVKVDRIEVASARVSESEKDVNTVNSKKDIEALELNKKEKESYELIKSLVDENNLISKYTLEGYLLYEDLKLSNFIMYHIILSLQNKGLLKTIEKSDGEYYLLVE